MLIQGAPNFGGIHGFAGQANNLNSGSLGSSTCPAGQQWDAWLEQCDAIPGNTGTADCPSGYVSGIDNNGNSTCIPTGTNKNGVWSNAWGQPNQGANSSDSWGAAAKLLTSIIGANTTPVPTAQPWYSTPSGLAIIVIGFGAIYLLMKN